jgi:hydrogenase nickel incorporation protein HypA/HybF
MHELAIADSVIDIALRHARGRRVTRVELRVGHLRQVVPSALTFAFELVAEGTEVDGAELVIEEMPATVRCRACSTEATLTAFPACCPGCGSLDVDVTGGDELLVDSLELEEDELLTRSGG